MSDIQERIVMEHTKPIVAETQVLRTEPEPKPEPKPEPQPQPEPEPAQVNVNVNVDQPKEEAPDAKPDKEE